jgi:hypothetical protein
MFCLRENTNTGFISLLDTNSPLLISKSIASELIKKLDIQGKKKKKKKTKHNICSHHIVMLRLDSKYLVDCLIVFLAHNG